MESKNSKEIFLSYFGEIEPKDEKIIDKIVKLTGNVPLVIEIMAKHTKEYLKEGDNLEQILSFYIEKELDKSINIYLNREKSTDSIKSHIEKIFDLKSITTNRQKELLTALANLNPNGVKIANLKNWLNDYPSYRDSKTELSNLGWLTEIDGTLKIHRIIKELVNQNIKQPKTIHTLVDSLVKQLSIKSLNNNDLNGKKYILDVKELIKNELETKKFATLLNNLSAILKFLENFNEAKIYQLKAIEIVKKIQSFHPDLATYYNNLAMILQDLGDLKEAKKYQLEAIEIHQKNFQSFHPDLATYYNSLSLILQDLGDLKEAKKYQLEAIEIHQKNFQSFHPNLATYYNNLAMIFQDLNNFNEAKKYQLEAIEIREIIFKEEPFHSILISSYNNLLKSLNILKNFNQLKIYQLKIIKIQEKTLKPSHPDLATSYTNMATFYYEMENYKEAKVWIDKAWNIAKEVFEESHPYYQGTLEAKQVIESKL